MSGCSFETTGNEESGIDPEKRPKLEEETVLNMRSVFLPRPKQYGGEILGSTGY